MAAIYKQRLAILTSFYRYAARQGFLPAENPIARVERRPVQSYAEAHALDFNEVKRRLAAIDRSELARKRDYALLSVAIQTGRRPSELASLTRGDLLLHENGKITLHWKHTKGAKAMSDTLAAASSRALLEWLSAYYGTELGKLDKTKPIWVSLSRQNSKIAAPKLAIFRLALVTLTLLLLDVIDLSIKN